MISVLTVLNSTLGDYSSPVSSGRPGEEAEVEPGGFAPEKRVE